MTYETEAKRCAEPGCENSFKEHRWGSIKAHAAGWFMQKDGTAWCPDHNPAWVKEWRARSNVRRVKTRQSPEIRDFEFQVLPVPTL